MKESCLKLGGTVNMAMLGLGCATAEVTGTLQVSGTWTASADRTYEDDLEWSGEEVLTLAPECLNVSGTVVPCNRLDGAISSLGYAEGLPYPEVVCVDDPMGGGCTCTGAIERPPGGVGTYTVANDVVTTSDGQAFSFCIEQNVLTMTPQRWAAGATTTTTGSAIAELDDE